MKYNMKTVKTTLGFKNNCMNTWWVKVQLKPICNETNAAQPKPRDFSKQQIV